MKNKHFEILVENGHYPLSYECSTIAEAYGCMESLKGMSGKLNSRIDLNEVMCRLVDMSRGPSTSFIYSGCVGIFVRDGEV